MGDRDIGREIYISDGGYTYRTEDICTYRMGSIHTRQEIQISNGRYTYQMEYTMLIAQCRFRSKSSGEL